MKYAERNEWPGWISSAGAGGQARLDGACRRLSARTGEGMGNMSVIY